MRTFFKFYAIAATLFISGYRTIGQTITADFNYSSVCETFHFNDKSISTGGDIATWYWDFGDGNNSTDTDPTHVYTLQGDYLVTLTVTHTIPGITDTKTRWVNFTIPEANFSFTPNCNYFIFVNTSIPLGELDSVFWYFGEGDTLKLTSEPFDATYSYSSEGEYVVHLKVFHESGCFDETSDTVSFYYPQVAFSYLGDCEAFQFINESTISSDTLTYLWHFGDGITSTEKDPFHSYFVQGNYNVSLIASHESGCSQTVVHNVSFYRPNTEFGFSNVCSDFNFSDETTVLAGNIESWLWDFGDASLPGTSTSPQHTYDAEGEYEVELKTTHESGCQDSVSHNIAFYFPEASFTYSSDCESFSFVNTSTPLSEVDSVFWHFGEGDTLKLFSMPFDGSHIYTDEGEYTVYLKVFQTGCFDSVSQVISFYHPEPGFTFTHICGNFSFTNESTVIGGELNYYWDFDDGFSSTEENPVHDYSTPGEYEVSLTVTHESGCDEVFSLVVSFYLPIAQFSHDPACFATQTCFYDESIPNSDSISYWVWDFGNGITSGLQNPCIIYANTGEYIVTLSVINSDGCSSDVYSDTLNVDYGPESAFSAEVACFNDTTIFINQTDTHNVEMALWQWNFGDPGSGAFNTSDLFEPYHIFSGEGPFTVSLYAENVNGCSSTAFKMVIVDSIPYANFSTPDTVVMGIEFTIDNLSVPHGTPIINNYWDFGDGTTAVNPNPVIHTYNDPGVYEICLLVTNLQGCTDSACMTIVVTGIPLADFTFTTGSSLITHFYDNSYSQAEIVDWFWDFGDLLTVYDTVSGNPNPVYTYPSDGYYSIYLRVLDAYGGIKDTSKIIYAGTVIIADFEAEDVCLGDTVMIDDNSHTLVSADITSWNWDFGDGSDSSYYEPLDFLYHQYDTAGVYEISLITIGYWNGIISQDTIIKEVSVFNSPVARIDSLNLVACLGQVIDFVSTSYGVEGDPISNWFWDFGNGQTSEEPTFSVEYTDLQDYLVTLTVTSDHQCQDTDTVTAKVTDAPNISFNVTNACLNSPAEFIHGTSDVEITEWFWNFKDPYNDDDEPDTSSLEYPIHVYSRVDLYRVTMYAASYGCSKTVEKNVIIKPIPFADFSYFVNDENIQGKVRFENGSVYATHYLWDFGNGHTSPVPDPTEVYEKDSTYTVTLISTNEYNCSDTSRANIKIFFRGLWFPNAFSPGNPNEEVALFSKGTNLATYEVMVFDMKGNLLWESTEVDEDGSPAESWDGYYDGRLMPEGMYIWKAQGMFRDGTVWKGSELEGTNPKPYGTVTLVK